MIAPNIPQEVVSVADVAVGTGAVARPSEKYAKVEVIRHPANRNVGRWSALGQADLISASAFYAGFTVLPKRGVVERPHSWNELARRLIMHHDGLTSISEAWVWLAEA